MSKEKIIAFPRTAFNDQGDITTFSDEYSGMTLRDYFAIRAPAPTDDYIKMQLQKDKNKNPHNDSYKPKIRSRVEIICDWNFEYADAMLKSRN